MDNDGDDIDERPALLMMMKRKVGGVEAGQQRRGMLVGKGKSRPKQQCGRPVATCLAGGNTAGGQPCYGKTATTVDR